MLRIAIVLFCVTDFVILAMPASGQAPDAAPAPAAAPHQPDPTTGEIDGVPPGKLSGKRTERGLKVISNKPGNRYTIEIPGKDFKPQHPERLFWAVDHKLIQILAVPLDDDADLSNAKETLLAHQRYENDFVGKGGWKETEAKRAWLEFPAGEPALYWEMDHPDPPGNPETRMVKHLFATTLNERNVIMLNAPVGAAMDEAACRALIRDTLLSLVRYEETPERIAPEPAEEEPKFFPAAAQAVLINADLATARDRRESTAIVIDCKLLMMAMRMALEFDKHPTLMTELTDGQSSHMVNLKGFDGPTKRILYWEPRGQGSFLSEGNNIAGVKAQPHPEERKMFYVTEPEMEKVVRGAILQAQYFRLPAYMGSLERAVQQYGPLHEKWPDAEETSQPRLLRAGELFLEMDDVARAHNTYAICVHLHPTSSRALAGLADIYVQLEKTEPAANFYGSALEKLPQDDTLDEAEKQAHQQRWTAALKKLPATAAPPAE